MVKSVGIGPWSAGLSFGDSTLSFIALWIGQAVVAGRGLPLLVVNSFFFFFFCGKVGRGKGEEKKL